MFHDIKLNILFAVLLICSSFALFIFFKPLKNKNIFKVLNAIVLFILIFFTYWVFGGFSKFYEYKMAQVSKKNAMELLKQVKNPQELVVKMEKHLENNPNSAKGWYLLGKLYLSQKNVTQTLYALGKAYKLEPNDNLYAINFASILLETGDIKHGQHILKSIIKKNPNQPDALAILAIYAYQNKQITQAINYWERLLNVIPENSPEADAIRLAIVKARKEI